MSVTNVLVERQFPDEPIEKMLSKFRSNVKKAGIFQTLKKKEYYEKPAVTRRIKKMNRKNGVRKQTN